MLLSAKKQAGMTWEEIADKLDMSLVRTRSACVGVNAVPGAKAEGLVKLAGLSQEGRLGPCEIADQDLGAGRADRSVQLPVP